MVSSLLCKSAYQLMSPVLGTPSGKESSKTPEILTFVSTEGLPNVCHYPYNKEDNGSMERDTHTHTNTNTIQACTYKGRKLKTLNIIKFDRGTC